ncbi:MAG TPA: PASTA domain-containing protein [Jatrophihabitantaceae bacterium]|nr:PASTA domain-containing protein [Jatrophihabitantaceae bacterium]
MGGSRELWSEGRQAWNRLAGWRHGEPYGGHSAPGEGALAALDDIGRLRRLLDRAELVAVRSARRHGKSWAEIATQLGVTRQSAWERWRDLDEAAETDAPNAAERAVAGAEPSAVKGAAEELVADIESSARNFRRRSTVRVPGVVGMTWAEANGALRDVGLLAVGWDANGLPLDDTAPTGVVTDQSPESGAKVPRGSSIRLWLYYGDGGSAGVREPRRPKPDPKVGRAAS